MYATQKLHTDLPLQIQIRHAILGAYESFCTEMVRIVLRLTIYVSMARTKIHVTFTHKSCYIEVIWALAASGKPGYQPPKTGVRQTEWFLR